VRQLLASEIVQGALSISHSFSIALPDIKKKEPTTIEKPINPEMLHNQGLHLMTDRVNCYFLHAAEPSLAVDLPMA
jgi:hypothetical protein